MSIESSKHADILVFSLSGRLDTHTAPEAEQVIGDAIDAGETRILVDFAQTDYISSAGLRVLLKATKRLKQCGGAFALCNASASVREVLEISGFSSIMPCFETLDEGLRGLHA